MAEKDSETLCIIDHANKLADRDHVNPNRKKRKVIRTWDKTSGETTAVEIPDWREPGSEDR